MKNHLAFKFIALILCAFALLVTVSSVAGVIGFAHIGLYTHTPQELMGRQATEDLTELAERTALEYALSKSTLDTEELRSAYLERHFPNRNTYHPQDGTWYYELIDVDSKAVVDYGPGTPEITGAQEYREILVTTQCPRLIKRLDTPYDGTGDLQPEPPDAEHDPSESEIYPETWDIFAFRNQYGIEESYLLDHDTEAQNYKMVFYMLPGSYEQATKYKWDLVETAYTNKYVPFFSLIAGLLVLGLCMTYLGSTAGKKPGRKDVVPAALNKLPLDLYLVLCVGVIVLLTYGYFQLIPAYFAEDTIQFIIAVVAVSAYLGCLVLCGFFFACAAQFQLPGHYWWRHSALRNLLKLMRRWVRGLVRLTRVCYSSLRKTWRRLVELLPLTWQWILWAVIMVSAVILAVLSRNVWIFAAAMIFVAASFFYALHAYKILLDGAKRMSQGDLETQVDKSQLMGGFTEFATHLNALADVAVVAAQKQMRSERMRAELITNVSHDIKTPLTSIINYVDLLKKADSKEDAEQYLEVLSRQSLRMKKLIDDLIELSKATTGNMPVDIQTADAVEYLNQAIGEFSDKLEQVPLTPIFEAPSEPVRILCDSRLTWRVLSNLLSNSIKYALPGTRLYINVTTAKDTVLISFKNISKEQLNVSSEELMERFVRGDTSRNTEGSGLGLNIAKSLMELQKGQLRLLVDGDLFKATLSFPMASD